MERTEVQNMIREALRPLSSLVRQLQGGDWVEATYENGWITTTDYHPAAYMVAANRVWLRGVVNGFEATAVRAFTLPPGLRPSKLHAFPVTYWTGSAFVAGSVEIDTDGSVNVYDNTLSSAVASNMVNVPLELISFRLG